MPPLSIRVNEPQLEAPLHGFTTAAVRQEEVDDRWVDGYWFRPAGVPGPSFWTNDRTGNARVKSTPVAPGPPAEFTSFVVELAARESTWGDGFDELRRKLLATFDTSLSWALERELWDGAAGVIGTKAFTQADAEVLASTAVSPAVGLALLTEALADSYVGALGMIHLPAAVGSLLVGGTGDAVALTGRRLATRARGDIVCIGSGYQGRIGPGRVALGATSLERWCFASPLYIWRADDAPMVVPDNVREAINTRTNDIEVRAEQNVSLAPAVPLADRLFAVRVNLAA